MTLPHQAEKVEEFTGTSTTRLRCEKTKVQICLVKTQDNSRWGAVSCAWSQNRHAGGCCRPLLASRSAVHNRCLIASQTKNLQRKGAQLFQILFHGINFIEPTKRASYADLLV